MSQVDTAFFAAGHIDDGDRSKEVAALCEQWNPGFRIGRGVVSGEEEWQAASGSRVVWIHDGEPPAVYRPDTAPPEWVDAVRCASARIDRFSGDLRTAIAGGCPRLRRRHYGADCANDLWARIEYKPLTRRDCRAPGRD